MRFSVPKFRATDEAEVKVGSLKIEYRSFLDSVKDAVSVVAGIFRKIPAREFHPVMEVRKIFSLQSLLLTPLRLCRNKGARDSIYQTVSAQALTKNVFVSPSKGYESGYTKSFIINE